MSGNKRRRVTCTRKYPTNELFKFWLEELKDQAFSNGLKTHYVFGKALKSLRSCPLELKSADDAKMLDNVGEKIVHVLRDKLRDFVEEHGEPALDNIHLAGVKVDVADDTNGVSGENSGSPKKRVRRSNQKTYIPGYRTGGYAILRALFDVYKEQNGNEYDEDNEFSPPTVGKQELQQRAQHYCDESMTTAKRDNPYTAWSSVNTLLKHDLVRMLRGPDNTTQFTVTKAGMELGKRLTPVASDDDDQWNKASLTRSPSPAKKQPKTTKSTKRNSGKPMEETASSSTVRPAPAPAPAPPAAAAIPNSPAHYSVSRNLFSSSPEPDLPGTSGDYGAGEYHEDFHAGVSTESLNNSIHLGYIYVDSDGGETGNQDKAYVMIDESLGDLWYLVKTTEQHVRKTEDRMQWRPTFDLPTAIVSRARFLPADRVLMFLRAEFADESAPGILETMEDNIGTKFGSVKETWKVRGLMDDPGKQEIRSTESSTKNDGAFGMASSSRSSQETSPVKTQVINVSPSRIRKAATFSATTNTTESSQSECQSIVFEPFTFEIVLVVDYAETSGGIAMFGEKTRNRKAFLIEGLDEENVRYVQRRLAVGDYLFVAREKTDGRSSSTNAASDRELVLGPVVERKRMDDLAASIRDGRFHEQKLRLHSCGIEKVVYLVEDYGKSMETFGLKEAALRSAFIGTQVCDGFDVIRKKNPLESARYLADLKAYLEKQYLSKRLVSRRPGTNSTNETALPTFQEFTSLAQKRRPLTVGDSFLRCLLQFPGVSPERAECIRRVYPTLAHLLDAYESCDGDQERQDGLLVDIQTGEHGRILGAEISKKIARFFCAEEPFTR